MTRLATVAGVLLLAVIASCGGGESRAEQALAGARELDVAVCDPSAGPFTLEITNPFLPYALGSRWVLEGEEDGETLRVEITVLDETELVAGVSTRVVEEREWEDGTLIEVSRNFVAQAPDGTVCYYGEDVEDYEDGVVVGRAGEWRAGRDGARAGILMPANPEVGTWHKQEIAPGTAEDSSVIVALGERVTVPAGTFTDTLSVQDVDPIDDEVDEKRYGRGVGLLVDESLLLIEYTP